MATAARELSSNLGDFDPKQDLARVPEPVRLWMAHEGLNNTYYLAYNILGFDKLTPRTHGPLCIFLDTCHYKRRLIQHPRSTFKTSLVTITKRIQDAMRDTSERILIVGDTDKNAQRHLSKIRTQFESNRLLRWLYPENFWEDTSQAQSWASTSLFLPTKALHGEPTFDTVGAGGGAVSRHFTIINADDLIGEKEAYSPTEMDRTIEWFTGLESLFVPPINDRLLDIPSTFWRKDDVYAFAETFYGRGKEKIVTGPYSYVIGDLAVFRRGAVEEGESIFPEGLPMQFLQRLQEENPERYAAQYANNPLSSSLSYFKPEYRRYYDVTPNHEGAIFIRHEKGELEIIPLSKLQIYSFCDPHAGGSQQRRFKSSRAAVITTGVDTAKQRIFILDCWIKRAPTDQIVDEILRQNEKWNPEIFKIEGNGFQRMLKFWIDERVERDYKQTVPYDPYLPKGDKDGDQRIRGLQPLYRAGHIYHGHGMMELEEEYLAWPRGLKDGLDCLAQGLEVWDLGWNMVEEEIAEKYSELLRQRSVLTGY